MRKVCILVFASCAVASTAGGSAFAQPEVPAPEPTGAAQASPPDSAAVITDDQVNVEPTADDQEIAARLQRILVASEWINEPRVTVEEGIVFLDGAAQSEEVKTWAANLARRTQDVVAVVNRLSVRPASFWNLDPARQGVRDLWRDTIAVSPFFLFALLILPLSWLAARLAVPGVRNLFERRLTSRMLANVLARAVGALVFLLGVYIVLRTSGLTRLAVTVLGGTGIIGLIIGIAFRDITENFLAGIFLSMQRPFLVGDLVEIVGVLGYVQKLTTRTTVLMTLQGNHVEIPNSTVYKNTICNYSTNNNRREDFTVGVGFDVALVDAQDTALAVLRRHPAVLADPEPWALVENLGSASVTLRIYFWLDGGKHSWIKVKSSVIRQVKRAFQDAGITMPDEAREIVFPEGVPLRRISQDTEQADDEPSTEPAKATVRNGRHVAAPAEPIATGAEGGLESEAEEIEDQARRSRPVEGEDLLTAAGRSPSPPNVS